MKCLKCGKEIESVVCPACGFNPTKGFFCSFSKTSSKSIPIRKMDVFYIIRGRIYTYEEARWKSRFDPEAGDRKIVRYLNDDGTMSDEEPTDEEIRRYLAR